MAFIDERVSEDPVLNDAIFKERNTEMLTRPSYEMRVSARIKGIAVSDFEMTEPYQLYKGKISLMAKSGRFGWHQLMPEKFTEVEIGRLVTSLLQQRGAEAVKISSVQVAVYEQYVPGLKGTMWEERQLNAFRVTGSYVHRVETSQKEHRTKWTTKTF